MDQEKFMNKYGKEKVKFSSYYKYTFTFKGKLKDGTIIRVSTGGDSDEIYREEVVADHFYTVSELEPYSGSIIRNKITTDDSYNF